MTYTPPIGEFVSLYLICCFYLITADLVNLQKTWDTVANAIREVDQETMIYFEGYVLFINFVPSKYITRIVHFNVISPLSSPPFFSSLLKRDL